MSTARALQLCPNDHPPFLDLCRSHAAALELAGLDVDTVFFGAPRGERLDGATYLAVERGTRHMIDALRRHCARQCYALVVAHRYRAYQVGTRALRRGDATLLVTVAHEFGMFARARRRWRRRLLARDGWFAGVSQAVVDELQRHDASLTRTLVLPNPADIDRLDATRLPRAAAREQLAIPQSVHAVGMIGRLHPEKRPLLALEAFAAARGLPDDARLVLIGDGTLRASLESSAESLGVGSRVRFAGYVPDAARYLSAFDTLLFASGATEAFGMALLEAMVAGVPVVCADMPGPRSVLGPQGCYFSGDGPPQLTSALERVAQMPDAARTQLCAAQRAHAERSFSVQAVAGIYRSLLSTGEPRRRDGS